MTTAPINSAITETADAVGIRSSALFGLRPYHEEAAVTIYHGDCRQIVPLLGRFDLLLTDPPYGIGADMAMHKASGNVVGHGHRRVAKRTYEASEWDSRPIEEWLLRLLLEKSDKQIIFGGNYYALPPCKGPLVWDKQNDGNNFADAELAWNNLGCPVRIKRHLWNGMARKGSEMRYDHPTQKPLELMAWCIGLAGDVQTILDPFAGSGTTGRAAKDLGKRITVHTLRHSFATAYLENGGSIHKLKELLGHAHLETTEIYTHCIRQFASEIASPLDALPQISNVIPFARAA